METTAGFEVRGLGIKAHSRAHNRGESSGKENGSWASIVLLGISWGLRISGGMGEPI